MRRYATKRGERPRSVFRLCVMAVAVADPSNFLNLAEGKRTRAQTAGMETGVEPTASKDMELIWAGVVQARGGS